MKPINLLPRVPLSRRLYKPVIAGIAALTAVIASGIVLLYAQYAETNRQFETEIARLEGQLLELAASEKPPRYADVAAYRHLVEQLEGAGRDWSPVFDLAAGLLPRNSSITAITADEGGKVTVAVRMPGLTEIAAYTEALREAEPIADAAALSFRLESSTDPGETAGASGSVYTVVIELILADPAAAREGPP